jgi:hypothetical protein
MNVESRKVSIILISVLLLAFMLPLSTARSTQTTDSFSNQSTILTHQYSILSQKLFVSVQPSLYNYYSSQNHLLYSDGDYPKLVTPQAVALIAQNLRYITRNLPNNDEQFANTVLTLVHQIPYVLCNPKYPVETLSDNFGDCVSLSLLAASIMKAGGLDVVLIHYTGISPGHINVGVYLPNTPVYHNFLTTTVSFTCNNKTYWTAETTPATDWKVGDQSRDLNSATAVVISLDNTEQSSPSQVSSSLRTSLPSLCVTVNLTQQPVLNENISMSAMAISGSISPAYPAEKNVTIYVSSKGTSTNYFTTPIDANGGYLCTWNFTSAGTYYITASCNGTSNYTGADSQTLTAFIGPESFVQFKTPNFNYIFKEGSIPIFIASQIRPLQGVDNFLNVSLRSSVSLSYDFILLKARHTVSSIQTKKITMPNIQTVEVWPLGNRRPQFIQVRGPDITITVPVNVPSNMGTLALPDDFNQTINNQFCFILQNDTGNSYSLNARALNNYEAANISQTNGSGAAFMNVSDSLKENTWYTVTQSLSENGVATNLQDSNGTVVESSVTPHDAMRTNGMFIFVANNVDNAVVFKNLQVQTSDNTSHPPTQRTQSPRSNNTVTITNGTLTPYVYLASVVVAGFVATAVYIKKSKQRKHIS